MSKKTTFTYIRTFSGQLYSTFKDQSLIRQGLVVSAISLFLVLWGLGLFIFSVQWGMFGPLPTKTALTTINQPIASEVYSADSVLLGRYYLQDRTPTLFQNISPWVISALISTEDARFYLHSGIDYRSMARVLIKSLLLQNSAAGGGSTLSQQLAKNLYPRKEFGFLTVPIGKIKEMTIARRLEELYTKEELLALYLNTVPFGDNVYGIAAASERFFGKRPSQLAPQEAAQLIGMLKGTYLYNPRVFPERALERRNTVLRQMQKFGDLDQAMADSLVLTDIGLQYTRRDHHEGLAPYFREHLRQDLLRWCQENKRPDGLPYNLYTDGLRIYTTIDSRIQGYVEEAVKKQMTTVQARFDAQWKSSKPWDKSPEILQAAIKKSPKYKALLSAGLSEEAILVEMNKPHKTSFFTPNGPIEKEASTLDSIKHHLQVLHAGSLVMDVHNGAIKAWVGGVDSRWFQYDQAGPKTKRQVGSTFKPLVYAAAMEQGIPPCDYISAERVVFTDREGWAPVNSQENYDKKYSMQGGLMHSVNTVSVRLLEQVGIAATVSFAKRLGIQSEIPEVPAIALGTPSLSLHEMARAYAAFANEGYLVTPWYLTTITDAQGRILETFQAETPLAVMQAGTARKMTHLLQGVVEEGTASGLRSVYGVRGPVAGKTGTTQSNADGWFIGMTPSLVFATRVGADDPRIHFKTTALGQGSQTALPIVGYAIQKIERDPMARHMLGKRFAALSPREAQELDCPPFKEDITFVERLFGRKPKETKNRNFGEKEEKRGLRKWMERRKN